MTPEELLAFLLGAQTAQRSPGPKRPTTERSGGRSAPTPAQVREMLPPPGLDLPVGPSGARWTVQPEGVPADPEMLRAYAGGTEYLQPGSYVAVEPAPAAPPAPTPSGPAARATLPSVPPRPSPHVVYPTPADMTFVRPANPPAPSDRGQVVTDYEPRSRARRTVDALFGRR